MSEKRECLVGHDDSSGVFAIVMIIIIVMVICAIIIYGGFFIGGFHSIKNYIVSFKHNVIDSNIAAA